MSFFQKLFGTGNKGLSKTEHWRKWDFFGLLDDLHVAFKSLCELKTESEIKTKEKDDFKIALEDKIDDIEFGNQTDLSEIWNWFSRDGQWETLMGQADKELKEKIFERADRWKKASG
jgi:hypothetical protein